MIKFLKEKWIFLVFVLVVFGILSISGNFKQSTSSAKYRSEISSNGDSARVAKWDVSTISKQNGATLDLAAGFTKTIGEETEGNWFIEISNQSEVTAILGNSSKIRIRLDQDSFSGTSANSMPWNFLKDSSSNTITNPVTLKVTLYKGNYDSVVTGYTNGINTITKAQFEALSNSEKEAYREVINSSIDKVELSNTTNQTFTKDVESSGGKLVYYYYKDFTFNDIAGLTDELKTLNMNDSSSNVTLCVNWRVSSGTSSGGSEELETKKYRTYEVFEGSIPEGYKSYYKESVLKTDTLGNSLGNVDYYIAYKEVDFFDYQIFTSSFGGDGEPSFRFKNDITQTYQIIYFSNLSTEQENLVKNYSLTPNTIEAFEHAAERLKYFVHIEFMEDNDTFQKSLTYLDYGLKCAIEFNIKVEQKD